MKCSSDGRDFLLHLVFQRKCWNDEKVGQRATLGVNGYVRVSLVHIAAGKCPIYKVK